jgi:hypothetical protein
MLLCAKGHKFFENRQIRELFFAYKMAEKCKKWQVFYIVRQQTPCYNGNIKRKERCYAV